MNPGPRPREVRARLIYLHGFRSSPESFKARLLARRMEELGRSADWFCPALPRQTRRCSSARHANLAMKA